MGIGPVPSGPILQPDFRIYCTFLQPAAVEKVPSIIGGVLSPIAVEDDDARRLPGKSASQSFSAALVAVQDAIVSCERCPRLRAYCQEIGQTRRRAYIDQTYWARPVPGFGDPKARILILGLAPGAHGANRTGRVFTGDGSGDFMYPVLHSVGLANQPNATDKKDGLKLRHT